MPLKEGSSDQVIAENIKTLMSEGKSQREAVAIAMQKAGRTRFRDIKHTSKEKSGKTR